MITIKGVYEEGKIKLLEDAPSKRNQKVLVTFIEEDDEDSLRNISLTTSSSFLKNYISDTDEDLYQEYLKK